MIRPIVTFENDQNQRLSFFLQDNPNGRDIVVVELIGGDNFELSMKDVVYLAEILKIEFRDDHIRLIDKIYNYIFGQMIKQDDNDIYR